MTTVPRDVMVEHAENSRSLEGNARGVPSSTAPTNARNDRSKRAASQSCASPVNASPRSWLRSENRVNRRKIEADSSILSRSEVAATDFFVNRRLDAVVRIASCNGCRLSATSRCRKATRRIRPETGCTLRPRVMDSMAAPCISRHFPTVECCSRSYKEFRNEWSKIPIAAATEFVRCDEIVPVAFGNVDALRCRRHRSM